MRPRYSKEKQPLPPPLPHETRTVGQVVAESLRLYGRRPWAAFAVGVGPAILDVLAVEFDLPRVGQLVLVSLAGAVLLTSAYVLAVCVAADLRPKGPQLRIAFAAGAIAFVPFPFLASVFILPGLAWLALVGLAVPVALIERRGLAASFRRALELGRADFVHALGTLATLTIVVFLTRAVLYVLLQGFGDMTTRVAASLADIVISPVLLLGAALLYYDQAARVKSRNKPRRSDADLSHAHDAHREGRPDAHGEPGTTG